MASVEGIFHTEILNSETAQMWLFSLTGFMDSGLLLGFIQQWHSSAKWRKPVSTLKDEISKGLVMLPGGIIRSLEQSKG